MSRRLYRQVLFRYRICKDNTSACKHFDRALEAWDSLCTIVRPFETIAAALTWIFSVRSTSRQKAKQTSKTSSVGLFARSLVTLGRLCEDHHGCTPSFRTILPTSSSLLPSKTLLIRLPATDGSPAPISLLKSAPPPRPVARKPGEIHHTLTPSSWSMRCHSRIIMFMPVLLLRYAGISKLFPSKLPFGQPLGEYLFTNKATFSVPARLEVPEVMKRRRGLGV